MSTRQLRPRSAAPTPRSSTASSSPAQLTAPPVKRAASASASASAPFAGKRVKLGPDASAPPSPPGTPVARKRASRGGAGTPGRAPPGTEENRPVVKRGAVDRAGARRGRAGAEGKTTVEVIDPVDEPLVRDGKPLDALVGGRKRAKVEDIAGGAPASGSGSATDPKHPKAALLASVNRTPFPSFKNPPSSQYYDVVRFLTPAHGYLAPPARPKELFDHPGAAAGCGQVPLVLDGLCRTIISQSVTSASAKRVKDALDEAYGRGEYRRMLDGGEARLMDVVGVGGLRKKGTWIFRILQWVDARQAGRGALSLEWLRDKTDREILEVFLGFQGVGLKTAYCMLLLNIGRERMAVDTHVWRLAKQLGWCPPNATADQCSVHLDLSVPDDLKYPLHILLWREGKGCKRCAVQGKTSLDLAHTATGICPIERFCRRDKGTPRALKLEKHGEGEEVVAREKELSAAEVAEKEEEKPDVDGLKYVEH